MNARGRPPKRLAWVLNLDADLELAAPQGYTPRRTVLDAMAAFVPVLARSLLGPEDVLVEATSPALHARGLTGRAFCPTPRALAALRDAGAEPEPAPGMEILRLVNSRAFASSLGSTLPGAAFVTTLDDARTLLARPPPLGHGWRVKRAFGMSGRGQRLIASTQLTEADLAFVRGGMPDGGVQIEPNVTIEREYAIHGVLDGDGTYRLGAIVEQRCDARGAWLATEPLHDASDALTEALVAEASRVAAALAGRGYFGPFGIDAFAYRGPENVTVLQLRSEINARYSMGFAVGFPSGTR